MRPCSLFLVVGALASLAPLSCARACGDAPDVQLYVDGFEPRAARFEVEDLGRLDAAALDAVQARGDIDGALRLDAGACGGPCRVALVTVFLKNEGAEAEPPPVIRLRVPPGRPARLPIAFRGEEISKGRIGRIRWLVQMYPEEEALTAVLSSSVRLVEPPAAAAPSGSSEPSESSGASGSSGSSGDAPAAAGAESPLRTGAEAGEESK